MIHRLVAGLLAFGLAVGCGKTTPTPKRAGEVGNPKAPDGFPRITITGIRIPEVGASSLAITFVVENSGMTRLSVSKEFALAVSLPNDKPLFWSRLNLPSDVPDTIWLAPGKPVALAATVPAPAKVWAADWHECSRRGYRCAITIGANSKTRLFDYQWMGVAQSERFLLKNFTAQRATYD